MFARLPRLFAFIILFLAVNYCSAQEAGHITAEQQANLHFTVSLPAYSSGTISQTLAYESGVDTTGSINLQLYQYNSKGDSLRLYQYDEHNVPFHNGVHQLEITNRTQTGKKIFIQSPFIEVLKKIGKVPPGSYKIILAVHVNDSFILRQDFLWQTDSTLTTNSPVRNGIDKTLLAAYKKTSGGLFHRNGNGGADSIINSNEKVLQRALPQLDRYYKRNGFTSVPAQTPAGSVTSVFYQGWFIGYYRLGTAEKIESQITRQRRNISSGIAAQVSNELGNYEPLFSQVKDLRKRLGDSSTTSGELSVACYLSNGQQEYDQQDNNYYELRGTIETTVLKMPVGIEAFYTSQDQHHLAKASYVHLHYDVDKAKDELLTLINGYNQAFSQTMSKGKGLDQIYGKYLSDLQGQKSVLTQEIKGQAGLPASVDLNDVDSSALKAQLLSSLQQRLVKSSNDSGSLHTVADSAMVLYQKAMKKYQQLKDLETKIVRYAALLNQYRNTTHFDSLLTYSNVKNLTGTEDMTYKQLAKRAGNLLPDGKVKTFAAGLTNLDAGIFNKYTSRYTAAGQQLKGLDIGYDLGFCRVTAMAGTTEYVGRDGQPDKYFTYSGSMLFIPFKNQEIGLTYYGYSPSRNAMLKEEFFDDIKTSLPSFTQPVHIISATYKGSLFNAVTLEGEAATSFRKGVQSDREHSFDANRIAWHMDAEGNIPKTTISIHSSYEHGGGDFHNSTMPLMLNGTDHYKAGVKGDLFKSFLTVGVEYNHMDQASFYYKAGNSRWGFELATHSRRFPTVSISYKPFETFRSAADTLNIPQRPMQGAVYNAKANYQLKRKGCSWRFLLLYNQSISALDSMDYSSTLGQVSAIYSTKSWMGQLNVATTEMSGGYTPYPMGRQMIVSLMGSHSFPNSISVTGGVETSKAAYGWSRAGVNLGCQLRMKMLPLGIQCFYRYASYRYSSEVGWKPFNSGGLGLSWHFETSNKKNN